MKKFKVEYTSTLLEGETEGSYILYQRRKFLFIPYWKRISVGSLTYVTKVMNNLKTINNNLSENSSINTIE